MAINIIGEINSEGFEAFVTAVEAETAKLISINLFSYGGSAEAALAFCSYMRMRKDKVFSITAYGSVESAAVLILAAGHRRKMTKEAWVMVHESPIDKTAYPSTTAHERASAQLRRMEDQWNDLLAERTKASAPVWGSMHIETTYLDAEECLELGLIDEIV